jgi:hypothetical protein
MENTCNKLEQSLTSKRDDSTDSLQTVHGVISPNVSTDNVTNEIGANGNRVSTEIEPKTEGNLVYITLCSCICKIW